MPLGIVHRDVSPSNLMVSYDGSVKVVDFGVAKATDRIHETHSGTVKGKISYMSPEQARGQTLDRRSDMFSLGIVMWEMLTVERLFKRESDFETMTAIVSEPPPPPSSRRPDVPPELDELVLRAAREAPRRAVPDRRGAARGDRARRRADELGAVGGRLSRFLRELFGRGPSRGSSCRPRMTAMVRKSSP